MMTGHTRLHPLTHSIRWTISTWTCKTPWLVRREKQMMGLLALWLGTRVAVHGFFTRHQILLLEVLYQRVAEEAETTMKD